MSVDIFHDSTKKVPRSDPRIVSQAFEEQQIGARKSGMPKIASNDLVIKHVTQK